MKIINGWIFCNRYLKSGKLTPCAVPLDIVCEIIEYNNDHTAIIIDHDGQMFEIDANIIEVLRTKKKYLMEHEK